MKNNSNISTNELKFRMKKNFYLIERYINYFYKNKKNNIVLNEFLILLNKIYNYKGKKYDKI